MEKFKIMLLYIALVFVVHACSKPDLYEGQDQIPSRSTNPNLGIPGDLDVNKINEAMDAHPKRFK